jgi:hypothetical protein
MTRFQEQIEIGLPDVTAIYQQMLKLFLDENHKLTLSNLRKYAVIFAGTVWIIFPWLMICE